MKSGDSLASQQEGACGFHSASAKSESQTLPLPLQHIIPIDVWFSQVVSFLSNRFRSLSVAMGYELDDSGSIPNRAKAFFSPPLRPHRICGPPNILSNGYRVLFTRGYGGWSVKLTTTVYCRGQETCVYASTPA
jgi:hypothetical protein